jgi:hypothetical protein
MSELIVYLLAGFTVLISIFLPSFLFYSICIPVLLLLLFILYKKRNLLSNDISPYLLSGASALFAIIAILFEFLSAAAWILTGFFLISSLIKGFLKKEAGTPKETSVIKTETGLPMYQETGSFRSKEQVMDSHNELLITFSRKIDQSLSEINTRLQKIENNSPSNQQGVDSSLIEKLRTSIRNDMMAFWNKNQEQMDQNFNSINNVLEKEMKMVENSIGILVNKMIEGNKTQQDIQASLDQIKQKSNNLATIDMIREIITENIKQDDYTFEMRHIQNYEIKNYLFRALEEAEEDVCIISPWISKWILTEPEYITRFENVLKRGVNLNILYGIDGNSSSLKNDSRGELTEKSIQLLKNALSKKKHKGKLQFGKINSHYKLFICDQKFYVETSMNTLSNKGDYGEGFQWHEGGTYSEHKDMLLTLKNIYFGPKNPYSAVQ